MRVLIVTCSLVCNN